MKAVAVDGHQNKAIWMVEKRPKAFRWAFHLTMEHCTPTKQKMKELDKCAQIKF